MSRKNDEAYIILKLLTKQFPNAKAIIFKVYQGVDMYIFKKRLIKYFDRKIQSTITDFRMVTPGPPEETNDTADPNFFDNKYDDDEAYELMKDIPKGQIINYRTIKSKVYVYAYTIDYEFILEYPLSYEGNSYEKLKQNIFTDVNCDQNSPIHIFQKTALLEEVKEDENIKQYQEKKLIAYLYPILVEFHYKGNDARKEILLKFNKPLKEYLPQIIKTLNIGSYNVLFHYENKIIPDDLPIHNFLKTLEMKEPIQLEITLRDGKSIGIIYVSIPIKGRYHKFIFQYENPDAKISELKTIIEEYFDLDDATIELYEEKEGTEPLSDNSFLKNYSNKPLFLKPDKETDFKMMRYFKINDEIKELPISPEIKIIKMIKQIANDIGSHPSLLSLRTKDFPLDSSLKFSDYFIPKRKGITVEQTNNYNDSIEDTKQKKQEDSSDDSVELDYCSDDEEDPIAKGNGAYERSKDDPDNDYIFHFKVIKGEEFDLQLPKDVTVKDAKEKIAENEGLDIDDVTIFAGNQRLADFQKLISITIPETVHLFTVKMIKYEGFHKLKALNFYNFNAKKKKSISNEPSKKTVSDTPDSLINHFIGADEEKNHQIEKVISDTITSIIYQIVDKGTKMSKKIIKIIENNTPYISIINAMKEFEILNYLHHPCICKVIFANPIEEIKNSKGETITTFALFTEPFEYNLKYYIKNNLINDTDKIKIIIEIAHGMKYIHEKKIIHKNLNHMNIFINSENESKICDFTQSETNFYKGDFDQYDNETILFKSPEILNYEKVDCKTDVYSFGIIVYFIIFGELPIIKMKDKISGSPIEFPNNESVQPICHKLINECLKSESSKRPSFEDILALIRKESYQLLANIKKELISERDKEIESS